MKRFVPRSRKNRSASSGKDTQPTKNFPRSKRFAPLAFYRRLCNRAPEEGSASTLMPSGAGARCCGPDKTPQPRNSTGGALPAAGAGGENRTIGRAEAPGAQNMEALRLCPDGMGEALPAPGTDGENLTIGKAEAPSRRTKRFGFALMGSGKRFSPRGRKTWKRFRLLAPISPHCLALFPERLPRTKRFFPPGFFLSRNDAPAVGSASLWARRAKRFGFALMEWGKRFSPRGAKHGSASGSQRRFPPIARLYSPNGFPERSASPWLGVGDFSAATQVLPAVPVWNGEALSGF